jgi:hypothetical protein
LPQNPVLLYRLDQWNWRLPSRRVEENRTRAVALLGDRGRRAGKKGKRRKGHESRVPFHETNPFLVTALSTAGRPNHFLGDCIGLVFSVPYPPLGQQSQFPQAALRAPTSCPASVAMGNAAQVRRMETAGGSGFGRDGGRVMLKLSKKKFA